MAGFWENDALVGAPATGAPTSGGKAFWEQDALVGAASSASAPAASEADRAMSALKPFFDKGVSTRNSAGQWTGEARALLTKEGLNPDSIDHKAERGLLSAYESRQQGTGDSAAAVGRGIINGVPVIGPALLGGTNKAVAFARSIKNGTSYTDELKNVEGFGERIAKENPGATTGGELAGGVVGTAPLVMAAPAAFGAGTAGLGVRSGASLLTGGALGGADSAVRSGGDLSETLKGAGVGGAFGGAAPAAGALIGKGVNAAVGALASRNVTVPGAGKQAAAKLTEDLRNSGGVDPVRARLDELGPEAMLLDASPSFEGRAQGLAVRPETRETVTAPIIARAKGANERLNADVEKNLGAKMDPEAFHSELDKAYDEAVPPLYAKALSKPVTVDTSAVLEKIGKLGETEKGGAESALGRAWKLLHTEGDVPGVGTANVPDRRPEALHNAKEALDSMIAAVKAQQGSAARSELRALTTVRSDLNKALEAQVPGYADANRTAQGFFQQREAFDRGQTLLNGGREAARPAALEAATAAMSPEAQQAQRLGLRTEVDRLVGTQLNDRVALQKAIQGEGDYNRARLSTVFGEEPTAGLVGAVDRERAFDTVNQNVVRNSQTAQRQAAAADMDVRGLMPDGGVSALGLAAGIGGQAGAAAATGVKAGKIGLNAFGRASDLARNKETAAILTMKAGAERDALIEALNARLEASSRGEAPASAMDKFVRQVLQSVNDRSERPALVAR